MNLELEDPSADFPAAHSMDTTWFAVDADGYVGVFDTSEDGAVPNAAATGGGAADPSFDTFLFEAARLASALVDDPGLLAGWNAAPDLPRPFGQEASAVVVLADVRLTEGPDHHRTSPVMLTSVEDAFPNAGWRVLRDAEPRVLACTKRLPKEALQELERRRDVAALVLEDELSEALVDAGGAFEYRHDYGETYAPGRYARRNAPKEPLKVSALTPEDQAHVGKVVLPFRFAETERFQLADVMRDEDCSIWADTTLRGEPLGKDLARAGGGASDSSRRFSKLVLLAFIALALGVVWWVVRR